MMRTPAMSTADFDCDLIQLLAGTTGSAGGRAGLAVLAKTAGGALVELRLFRSLEAAAAARAAMPNGSRLRADRAPLPEVRHQLTEYFAGERRAFALPLAP